MKLIFFHNLFSNKVEESLFMINYNHLPYFYLLKNNQLNNFYYDVIMSLHKI